MSDLGNVKCPKCQGAMELVGHVPLLTGSHSAAAKLVFGQLAELDEKPWPVEVHRCASCSYLEMYDRSEPAVPDIPDTENLYKP